MHDLILNLIYVIYSFVIIAMEAMDQLLVACHAQTLNLFVESFLKMVQKLLESTEPQLQILATQSVSLSSPNFKEYNNFFCIVCSIC